MGSILTPLVRKGSAKETFLVFTVSNFSNLFPFWHAFVKLGHTGLLICVFIFLNNDNTGDSYDTKSFVHWCHVALKGFNPLTIKVLL